MDMLFKRYANPMVLLDSMICGRRFHDFIVEFLNITNEELEDQTIWDLWLHRVYDQSYADFYAQAKKKKTEKLPSRYEIEATVKGSAEMLNGFHLS